MERFGPLIGGPYAAGLRYRQMHSNQCEAYGTGIFVRAQMSQSQGDKCANDNNQITFYLLIG